MADAETPSGITERRWSEYALAVAIGALGLLMAHHSMIFSGLRLEQGIQALINRSRDWKEGGEAFAQKRKTLANNLRAAGIAPESIQLALSRAEIGAQARAEELSLEDLATLYKALRS